MYVGSTPVPASRRFRILNFIEVPFTMKRILCLFLCGFLLTACGEEKPASQLVVGTSADYPPFEFYQDGQIVGLEVDLIREIAKELDKECVFKDLPFESLIGALQTKNIDLAISNITATPERLEKSDFSIPYYRSYAVMIAAKDSAINSVADLTGKTIGVQSGTIYEATVKKDWALKTKDLKVMSLAKVPDLLQAFKAGRIDVLVMGISEADRIVKTVLDLKIIPLKETEVVFVIAFPKGSPLVEPVNKILKKWTDNGILKKWQDKSLSE
ncbi:substrate-binding periplasmic protein [Candidatus Finniella inopinata]|uniref:Amino acid ABC transporter substrate-binding protein n=1 Tax=Candidatus Finniella inopinata TaxID=1696036 RepID=A0A4Q7DGF3_9PROT|nr:ABC transporter substrate-binding protein [Candidatus Finniella inopinata]RZI45360.1 amino acid ABC transporter substrate-binding protein [Candidatus Finniella inopinata]